MRPVCLIVRDGWGYNENPRGNAVAAARKPYMDSLLAKYPWTLLETSGEPVGLPPGYQGSSEVGHLNMGAGRIVVQEVRRVDDLMRSGEMWQKPVWRQLIENWERNASQLHLLGLLQDEGVHAHQEQIFKIMRQARREFPAGRIVIHPFLDGRDTPPRSTKEYLAKLRLVMQEVGGCAIGTLMGRFYAMDRNKDWKLTDQAYHCLALGEGRAVPDEIAAVDESYARDKMPDGKPVFDEFIPPCVLPGYQGIRDGDSVLHCNYRQDRATQLSRAFVGPSYPGSLRAKPKVVYVGLTRYYDEFPSYLTPPMSEGAGMTKLLGEVIANRGLRQLRIAETFKFRHVTSFFNGKQTTPFVGEDQAEVASLFAQDELAGYPFMQAYAVTGELLRRLDGQEKLPEKERYAFIAVNYANGDMVGHTGDFDAARKAIETVDDCLGRLVPRLLELDAQVLITADHGNAEQMIYYENGMPKTSHTLFPVECLYVARDSAGRRLIPRGKLSDIAPTVLSLLGIAAPEEMTAQSLIVAP